MLTAEELKSRLSVDMTKELMEYLGAEIYQENEKYCIYTSICHGNPDSRKLYYYKDTNSFYCWSQCSSNVDVISLTQQIEGLDFQDAIQFIIDFFQLEKKSGFGKPPKIKYTPREIKPKEIDINEKLPIYNSSILNTFYSIPIAEWLNEGISNETMKLFNIKFDIEDRGRIIIPHYDINNRLIGIRVRNLDKEIIEGYGKYLPLRDSLSNITYSHKLGQNLYGIHLNKENIKKYKKVILVESEKSVMKIQEFYPNDNIALALCGSNITPFQLELLKSLDVKEVIYSLDKENNENWLKKIDKIYKKTALLFDVYIVDDTEGLLELKDSPCDKGKDVFDRLIKNRVEYSLKIND